LKLRTYYKNKLYEVGCDEAGRGPLAGPVFAAAVILNPSKPIRGLNDSKVLTEIERNRLRNEIEEKAREWSVCSMNIEDLDRYNILQASLMTMRNCILSLKTTPALILVDGNQKIPYLDFEQYCIIKGDGKFKSIAAASILAKTYRDEYMLKIHEEFPQYGWNENKGYATLQHRLAIQEHGTCIHHRKTFRVKLPELDLYS
jgi:ribonuclease HII